ncbi:hypothetical protein [Novosphingobium sp. ZW T3_23]|uniref:hypothetical protein n=1 Tax=Novosphingobium sp. ZW T3_23 TaxID=3378084 RepID=UPI003851C937
MDRHLTGPDRIVAIEYDMRLTVLPELKWQFSNSSCRPSDAARLDALTVDALMKAFAEFEEIPRPDTATGSFIAVPDWLPYAPTRYTLANFVYSDPTIGIAISVFALTDRLVAVHTPQKFASELDVTLEPDGTVYVKRSGPETNLIWFEYDSRNEAGQIATSRAYLATRRY